MKFTAVYPGTFCPPTWGHLAIARRATEVFGKVIVICSQNPDKQERWFSPEECKAMWLAYRLPKNISVETYDEFVTGQDRPRASALIMIRGVRNESDFADEKKVALVNYQNSGIDKFFYLYCENGYEKISSSATRAAAENLELELLATLVAPLVVTRLLEKVLKSRNIFMVVGQPAAGKSTLLKMLAEQNPKNVHINTDSFNEALKPLLAQVHPGADLIEFARLHDEELKKIVGQKWLAMLKNALEKVPPDSNVFVEIAYGLGANKNMFRFVGGKIIYVGCDDNFKENRLIERDTPELAAFIPLIPNRKETLKIVKEHKLSVTCFDTDGLLKKTEKLARAFNRKLERRH